MNSILVAAIVLGSALGGTAVGIFLQQLLPGKHLQPETKDVVRLGTGLIATMVALVLGLLVSAAKSSFDEETSSFRQLALDVVVLDRTLAQFGEEASPAREHLKRTIGQTVDSLWPQDSGQKAVNIDDARITAEGTALLEALRGLAPHDEEQQRLKSEALQLSSNLTRERWHLSQTSDGTLPHAFLVVLAFWLAVLFGSFGLFSPRNPLALGALVICAASVAGAVFLIVDLGHPFDGLVQVSDSSLRDALSKLGK